MDVEECEPMSSKEDTNGSRSKEPDRLLNLLAGLVELIDLWTASAGWTNQRIQVKLRTVDGESYRVPGLQMQKETYRLLLEPVGGPAPGAEVVVDLYLLPGYDDIASLYFSNGHWRIHYAFEANDSSHGMIDDATSDLLSRETLQRVLDAMAQHVA
jgi:hypothetical protein